MPRCHHPEHARKMRYKHQPNEQLIDLYYMSALILVQKLLVQEEG